MANIKLLSVNSCHLIANIILELSFCSCFISPGPALYYGLLLQVGLILLHNLVVFALIMRRLLKSGTGGSAMKNKMAVLSIRLQNAVIISVLLGLTWVFGFLAIADATFAFQLLFCICNSLQGVLILLLFCLRDEDVRKTLRPYMWCCGKVTTTRKGRSGSYNTCSSGDKTDLNRSSTVRSTSDGSYVNSSLELSESESGTK